MSIVQAIQEAMTESDAGLSVTTDVVLQQFDTTFGRGCAWYAGQSDSYRRYSSRLWPG